MTGRTHLPILDQAGTLERVQQTAGLRKNRECDGLAVKTAARPRGPDLHNSYPYLALNEPVAVVPLWAAQSRRFATASACGRSCARFSLGFATPDA
jgi:hypothetical protein